MTRIDIAVYDGCDELDVLGPMEVLRTAAAGGADLEARLVVLAEPLEVTGSHGLRFRADALYQRGADVLLVPGGGWFVRDGNGNGAFGEAERGAWPEAIRQAASAGTVVAGVCTGVMLLARAGVVGNRPATTHHRAHADLAGTGAEVRQDRVVDDGDLITAGGVTSGLDLALGLVARFAGESAAKAVAEEIEYPWRAAAPAAPTSGGHRVTTEDSTERVKATFGGTVVADTTRALVLRETGLPPVYYLPTDDVRMDLLTRTDHQTVCPFKGRASHWSLEVDGRSAVDVAWGYESPKEGREDLKGRVAFYTDRLDAFEVSR
ncbi:MAG: DUF427 domain-containing protein [Acidimicrobiia bacterium]